MPVEQADNTRVEIRPLIPHPPRQDVQRMNQARMQQIIQQNQAQLWDADKVKMYQNMQNLYNNSVFGYGVSGRQTNYDPRTSQGQAAIQANYNYTESNFKNFIETLATAGVAEGAGQVIRWAITPTKIGSGAEAIVSSAPASTRVTKVTTIPRSEMHLRNTVPGALPSTYVDSSAGLTRYTQPKIKILSKEQLAKAREAIDKLMGRSGWRKITHPNLEGAGYTNGRWVVSDLGEGNVGKDWLGRIRFPDFSIESVSAFRTAIQKQGGKLLNNN